MKILTLLLAIILHTVLVGRNALNVAPCFLQTKPLTTALHKLSGFNHDELIVQIVIDKVDRKFVKNTPPVSLALTKNMLEVNNTKQTEGILKKFRTKYKITKGVPITHTKTLNDSLTMYVTKH